MQLHTRHQWDVTPKEAIDIQKQLADQIQLQPLTQPIGSVAGADVSFNKNSELVFAAVVLLSFPQLTLIEQVSATGITHFPYIPGLLSFREAPILLAAFEKLSIVPDVVICDGHGIAHPRRLGIAAHLGLCLERPTLGCAKKKLTGLYEAHQLAPTAGATIALKDKENQIIGSVVRTKMGIKPVFVSPGHQMDITTAVDVVLNCCRGYKLPEPTRQAHLWVNQVRRAYYSNKP